MIPQEAIEHIRTLLELRVISKAQLNPEYRKEIEKRLELPSRSFRANFCSPTEERPMSTKGTVKAKAEESASIIELLDHLNNALEKDDAAQVEQMQAIETQLIELAEKLDPIILEGTDSSDKKVSNEQVKSDASVRGQLLLADNRRLDLQANFDIAASRISDLLNRLLLAVVGDPPPHIPKEIYEEIQNG